MALVLALVPTHALAWDSTGVVTGRIYDELQTNPAPLSELHAMQVGWVRIEFEEFYGLPAGTPYTDSRVQARKVKFQQVIQHARSRGLRVLGVIAYSAMPPTAGFPDTDAGIQAYVTAVRWHLDNYAIDAIQIWNEPSSNVSFTNNNLARYAKTLVETYRLKPSYPNVLFVGPSTVNAEKGTWLGYHGSGFNPENSIFNAAVMRSYRAANGRLPMDVVSWHPYGGSTTPPAGDPTGTNFYFGRSFATYYNEILAYKDVDGRSVINGAPIWFTEYGWDSSKVGEENQRIYTEKMMTLIFARPQVKVPFLYVFRDDESGVGSEGKSFGIRKNSVSGFAKKRVWYPVVSKNSLAGLFTQDGVSEWTIDQIADKYVTAGGVDVVGRAYRHPNAPWYGDKAHYWGPGNNGIIQQFNGAQLGECGILMKVGAAQAWLVKGDIYRYYMGNNGPYTFGWPLTDEYSSGGYIWQNYEWGKMRWSSGTVVWFPN
jgi:hypothetical protein